MADASYLQTSFLGGEWSPYSQGRADKAEYRTAMNLCYNSYPVEGGAWLRRSGTRFIAPTRSGAPGKLYRFQFQSSAPYQLEFTDGHMRLFSGPNLVVDAPSLPVFGITKTNPAVVATAVHGWSAGDQVMLIPLSNNVTNVEALYVFNKQFRIGVPSTSTVTLFDSVTGAAFDGSKISVKPGQYGIVRVTDFATPYTGTSWKNIKGVQSENRMVLLHNNYAPYLLTCLTEPTTTAYAGFTLAAASFKDGPYMDPPTDGSTVTASALTGSITLTFSWGPTATQLVASDVGRIIRLFSEPSQWSAAVNYTVGQNVKYGNSYYQCTVANNNVQPDTSLDKWSVTTTAAKWCWATITAVTDASHCTVTLADVPLLPGANPVGTTPLLYASPVPITVFRMGLYSPSTGYPTCGTWHEGRLWLAGSQKNHFDACVSNGFIGGSFIFSPTAQDGTVADNNAISYTFNSSDEDPIYWMLPDHNGVVCGTKGGEYVIQASNLSDPLTPTSIQAKKVTKYGCSDIEPRRTPLAICFVQRLSRNLVEYVADVYSGKYSGTNISQNAGHLVPTGIAEIAYQQLPYPVLWMRMNDGSLVGCSYKRESPFGTQPAAYVGWHSHGLATGRVVESIQDGTSNDGTLDAVTVITNDPATNVRWVELMMDPYSEAQPITQSWFLDSAILPTAMVETVVNGVTGLKLYGFNQFIGKTITAWVGLDLGDYTVATDGTIFVPYSTSNSLFTADYLATLTNSGQSFGGFGGYVQRFSIPSYPNSANPTQVFELVQEPNPPWAAGIDPNTLVPDWDVNTAYFVYNGISYTGGFARYDLSTGLNLNRSSLTTIGTPGDSIGAPVVVDRNHKLYWYNGGGNAGILVKVDGPTLTFEKKFGSGSSALTTDPTHLAWPRGLAPFVWGTKNYIMCANKYNSHEVAILLTDTNLDIIPVTPDMTLHQVYTITETKANVCPGLAVTNDNGSTYFQPCYAMGSDTLGTTNYTYQPLGWYVTSAPNATLGALGTFTLPRYAQTTVQQIDPKWNNFSSVSTFAVDQTDGNFLLFVGTTTPPNINTSLAYSVNDVRIWPDGKAYVCTVAGTPGTWSVLGSPVPDQNYLVKISAADGSVMWKIEVPAVPAWALQLFRVTGGRMYYTMQTNLQYHLYTVDTINGVIVQDTVIPGVSPGIQFSDVKTGQFICWSTVTTAIPGCPTPAGRSNKNGWTDWTYFNFGQWIPPTPGTYFVPAIGGVSFTSKGQLLRPIAPQEAGATNGPALGKTRRSHMYAALVQNCGAGVTFGTSFDPSKMCDAPRRQPNGVPYADTALYNGVLWDVLQDGYSFDSMPCWQVSRPYPLAVVMMGAFLHTQDR